MVADAKDRARRGIAHHVRQLHVLRANTLQAAVRNGGRFEGKTAEIDLPRDFGLCFEEPIAEAWGKTVLSAIRQRTQEYADDCIALVEKVIEWAKEQGGAIPAQLVEAQRDALRSDARKLVAVGKDAADQLRTTVRQQLIREIDAPIREQCKQFVAAGLNKDYGVKDRILGLLGQLADKVIEAAGKAALGILLSSFRHVEKEIREILANHKDPPLRGGDCPALLATGEPQTARPRGAEADSERDPCGSGNQSLWRRIVRQRTRGRGMNIVRDGTPYPSAVLRGYNDWGVRTADLVNPPHRFWADGPAQAPPSVESGVDARRVRERPSPARLLGGLPEGDSWPAHTRRSLGRLMSFFLLCEDPQRRLDARAVNTLAHQVSVVQHVLESDRLRRVLIADEVGLGKTIEAGLIFSRLLDERPGLRVLYLAPARLVNNVAAEMDRLGLPFRHWAAQSADARLTDPLVVASIHRAVHEQHFRAFLEAPPWDVLVVDECHHLSDWTPAAATRVRTFAWYETSSPGSPPTVGLYS